MAKQRITDRSLTALKPSLTCWDTEVAGLGARRQVAGGEVTFIFKYRSPIERDTTGRGRQRLLTMGRWARGDWAIDTARKQATAWRDALRLGRDPAAERDRQRTMLTVAELCDAYLAEAPTLLLRGRGRAKKPSTLMNDASRIEAHVKPLLGSLPVDTVTRAHVESLMLAIAAGKTARNEGAGRNVSNVRGGKGAAARTVGLLGSIFGYAIKRGLRIDNPVRGIERFADQRRQRRLGDGEYRALATGLSAAEAAEANRFGLAAIRLLLLTGWRLSEATGLRWAEVDLARRTATLGDTKTGLSVRPLSQAAVDLIAAQPRTSSPFVFPARTADKALQGLPRMWDAVRKRAGLPADVTMHVLRHSFASLAADLGYGDAAIAGLIGHKRQGITSRYTHAADAVLLAAADAVASRTAELMGNGSFSGSAGGVT